MDAVRKQRYQNDVDRIAVEGRFGVAKRKSDLGLIISKLKETSEAEINISGIFRKGRTVTQRCD